MRILEKYNVVCYDYGTEKQYRLYKKSIRKKRKKILDDDYYREILKKSVEYEVPTDEDIIKQNENKLRSINNSANRSKNKVYEYARANEWEYFITLTFDPKKVDSTNYDLVVKKTSQWFKDRRKRQAPDLKYIIVPELHADGKKWHFHALIANVGNIKFNDSSKKDLKGRKILNIGNYKLGWSTATAITDTKKASNYLSKYLTKELANKIIGKKRYWNSKNLNLPIIEKFDMDEDAKKDLLIFLASQSFNSSLVEINLPDYSQQIQYFDIKV